MDTATESLADILYKDLAWKLPFDTLYADLVKGAGVLLKCSSAHSLDEDFARRARYRTLGSCTDACTKKTCQKKLRTTLYKDFQNGKLQNLTWFFSS